MPHNKKGGLAVTVTHRDGKRPKKVAPFHINFMVLEKLPAFVHRRFEKQQ